MILINIKMPESCNKCPFLDYTYGCCELYSYGVHNRYDLPIKYYDSRPDWCELKEIKMKEMKMSKEEAVEYLTAISYKFGTTGVEYLTEKDGEKMREAIEVLKGGING